MGVTDWILLALIGAYAVYVLFFKKKSGCCGDCCHCPGCRKEKTPH